MLLLRMRIIEQVLRPFCFRGGSRISGGGGAIIKWVFVANMLPDYLILGINLLFQVRTRWVQSYVQKQLRITVTCQYNSLENFQLKRFDIFLFCS